MKCSQKPCGTSTFTSEAIKPYKYLLMNGSISTTLTAVLSSFRNFKRCGIFGVKATNTGKAL